MSTLDSILDPLASRPICGYGPNSPAAVEPTALAAMALLAGRRHTPAARALQWLVDVQAEDGSLGIDAANAQPVWPTALAVLAWHAALAAGPDRSAAHAGRWAAAARRAVDRMLAARGETSPQLPAMGHDTMLIGWPWVESTHAWVEPTAVALLGLRAAGLDAHSRSRQAVELLIDRMLPSGGWNYGNTVVLGSTLRPHLQPTGIALAALHGESKAAEQIRRSIGYLHRTLNERTATASLCYALWGAAACGHRPQQADRWLEAARARTLRRDRSPYKLALLALARSQKKWNT